MKPCVCTGLVVLLVATTSQVDTVTAANDANADIIRHSDIDMVSWYPPGQHTLNPDDFRKWGATLVSWGLDTVFTRTQNVPQPLGDLVKAAHDGGVRDYLANLDMCSAQPWNLAKDAELREAIARDFGGNGLVVPWFPAVVDGVPAYEGCLNNPVYRENVRQRIRESVAAGCKGLHVDCANGVMGVFRRHGGCFCECCMKGFKRFLVNKYSQEQLSGLGLDDIGTWDFAADVQRATGTTERLVTMTRNGQIEKRVPVFRDYRAFLNQSYVDWLKELAALTKQLGGPDAGFSINHGRVEPWLPVRSFADFFTCEVRHAPEKKQISSRVIGLYRAAESLDRMLSVTAGTVPDWPHPAKGGMDNLVAMWVAFAYANGHLFIVPNNVWCYSEEKGEHAYRGPDEVFLPLYRFIRNNEHLLDGYDPIEQVGVVHILGGPIEVPETSGDGNGGRKRKWVDPFSEICSELTEAHFPFGVVFPSMTARNGELLERDLKRFERVVIPEGVALNGKDKTILEAWKRDGRAIPWADPESTLRGVDPLIRVARGNRVWALPRRKKQDPAAPVVCHLFNPCYDADRDTMIEQTDIVISIRSDLLNRPLRKAILHTPGKHPQGVSVRQTGERAEITVPKLTLWAILSLE
jgi:hypothetical protein